MATIHDPIMAADQLIRRFEAFHVPDVAVDDGWDYAPDPLSDVAFALSVCGTPDDRHVCDIGSGIGTKLYFIRLLGWENVVGIELRHEYVAVSRVLFPECEVIEADALLTSLADFDVVIAQEIARDRVQQAKFDDTVISELRTGSIIVFPYRDPPPGLEALGYDAWRIP